MPCLSRYCRWIDPVPSHPASGNGAITSLFHAGRQGRVVPEPIRWTSVCNMKLLAIILVLAGQQFQALADPPVSNGPGSALGPRSLTTRHYSLDRQTFFAALRKGVRPKDDGFSDDYELLRNCLEQSGFDLSPPSMLYYKPLDGLLMVRAKEEDQNRIGQLLADIQLGRAPAFTNPPPTKLVSKGYGIDSLVVFSHLRTRMHVGLERTDLEVLVACFQHEGIEAAAPPSLGSSTLSVYASRENHWKIKRLLKELETSQ